MPFSEWCFERLHHRPLLKAIGISSYFAFMPALAVKHSSDFRLIIDAQWFKRAFGELQLIKNTDAETAINSGGYRLATSPARLPHALLDNTKTSIGSPAFSAQYLQAPIPAEDAMLKKAWLRLVDAIPLRQAGDQVIQSWDTALKAKDSNDYSVGLTFLVRGRNEVYLTDVVRARMEFPELKDRVVREASNQAATTVLIEEHGSGISLIQFIKSAVLGVKGISHQSDKETRMYAATPLLEGGLLHLPKTAPWLDDFQDEFLAFPNGKHDDQMDALSQFLNWHGEKQRSFFQADWGWDDAPRAPSADSLLGMLRR